nr:hypothetical protein [Nocardia brasiliensis]
MGTAAELLVELAGGFALVGGERRDVDQRGDVVETGGGFGDDRTAVGVTYQGDRAGGRGQEGAQVLGVVVQAAQRVGGGDDG